MDALIFTGRNVLVATTVVIDLFVVILVVLLLNAACPSLFVTIAVVESGVIDPEPLQVEHSVELFLVVHDLLMQIEVFAE